MRLFNTSERLKGSSAWYCIGFFERILKRIRYLPTSTTNDEAVSLLSRYQVMIALKTNGLAHPHSRHLMISLGLISTRYPQLPQIYLVAYGPQPAELQPSSFRRWFVCLQKVSSVKEQYILYIIHTYFFYKQTSGRRQATARRSRSL